MMRTWLITGLVVCATAVMGGCPQPLDALETYNGDLDAALAKAESAAQQ